MAAILSSAGHFSAPVSSAEIFVAPPGTPASADWKSKVEKGAALILAGSSPLAASFGYRDRVDTVSVVHLIDIHNPALPIIWEKAMELPVYEVPASDRVFAKDRWTSAPLVAGVRVGLGAVLWVAAPPGQNGYERFPYLMQALADLGFEPTVRRSQLWAFFDYSYRTRADPDYLVARWRKAGISAIHVASWHFYDSDAERDEYLKRLIEACHRRGVLHLRMDGTAARERKILERTRGVAGEDRRLQDARARLAKVDEPAEPRLRGGHSRRTASR